MNINWDNVTSLTLREALRGWSFTQPTPVDCLRATAIQPFVWPGGYELAVLTKDGGLICWKCVREEYESLYRSTIGKCNDGWEVSSVVVVGQDIDGDDTYCDHCNRVFIEDGE